MLLECPALLCPFLSYSLTKQRPTSPHTQTHIKSYPDTQASSLHPTTHKTVFDNELAMNQLFKYERPIILRRGLLQKIDCVLS